MHPHRNRIDHARQAIAEAEIILIGGGAGLSAAAGLDYSGQRFLDTFADFIEKYGIEDMYSASSYPFETQEESWARWARHIDVNRFSQGPTLLYQMLLRLVQDKEFFVITTNVESQFEKTGFPKEKIFEVQGNYAYLQCAKTCHPIVSQVNCGVSLALVKVILKQLKLVSGKDSRAVLQHRKVRNLFLCRWKKQIKS